METTTTTTPDTTKERTETQSVQTDWTKIRRDKTAKIVSDLGDFVNSGWSQELFNQFMDKEHRALQCDLANLFTNWLLHCAKPDYPRDGRNEGAHRLGQLMEYGMNHTEAILYNQNYIRSQQETERS